MQRLSEFLRAQLLCLRGRFGALLDVADPIVEDLPDQPAEPVGNRLYRTFVAESRHQPPEHVLKAANLLIYRRVRGLASAKSLFRPFGARLE